MLEQFGPLLKFEFVLTSSFIIYLAIYFWWGGHVSWLIVKQKKIPTWLIKRFDDPSNPFEKVVDETKVYHIYLAKGMGWIIILLFVLYLLFVVPDRQESSYPPIIGNVELSSIGEVIYVIVVFIFITGILRWVTWE